MPDRVELIKQIALQCYLEIPLPDLADNDDGVECNPFEIQAEIKNDIQNVTVIPHRCNGCKAGRKEVSHVIQAEGGMVTRCKEAGPFAQAALKLAQEEQLIP